MRRLGCSNQYIHFVFVPTILWTVMVALSFETTLLDFLPLRTLPLPLLGPLPVNLAAGLALAYAAYYLYLHPALGVRTLRPLSTCAACLLSRVGLKAAAAPAAAGHHVCDSYGHARIRARVRLRARV